MLSSQDSETKPGFFDKIVATSKARQKAPHFGPMQDPTVTC